MFQECFEAHNILFCGFWSFAGVEGQMCVNVRILIHILKPKSFRFVDLGLLRA